MELTQLLALEYNSGVLKYNEIVAIYTLCLRAQSFPFLSELHIIAGTFLESQDSRQHLLGDQGVHRVSPDNHR